MAGGPVRLDDLKSVRAALGKSQSELANMLGLSTRAVQSYEQGWRQTPPHVQKLAGLLVYWDKVAKGVKVEPCYRTMKCPSEDRRKCRGAQLGGGQFCWLVTGELVKGQEQQSWQDKMGKCTRCPVMKSWLQA